MALVQRILMLLFAAMVAGITSGLTLLVCAAFGVPSVLTDPEIIGLAAMTGAAVGGPWALLCGGAVRLVARQMRLRANLSLYFLAAGLVAGPLLTVLLVEFDFLPAAKASLYFGAALAGATGALAFQSVMPSIPFAREP